MWFPFALSVCPCVCICVCRKGGGAGCATGPQRSHVNTPARTLRIRGAKVVHAACMQHWRRDGIGSGGIQKSDQPVRAAGVARRALVGSLQHGAGGRGVWKSDRDLDHPGAQADADRHKLLPSQLGVLRCVHGRVQHAHQFHLRDSRRLVLWRGVLQVSQLLPGHGRVCQHLLYDRHCHWQVMSDLPLVPRWWLLILINIWRRLIQNGAQFNFPF